MYADVLSFWESNPVQLVTGNSLFSVLEKNKRFLTRVVLTRMFSFALTWHHKVFTTNCSSRNNSPN